MYLPFDQRQAVTLALLEKGYEKQMFLAADSCGTLDWFPVETVQQLAGAGMVKDWDIRIVPDQVLPELREKGMTEDQERTMMVANPVRWLIGEEL
jgi:phosphotriesterase-related protein